MSDEAAAMARDYAARAEPPADKKLPSTQQTFGHDVEGDPCPRCRSTQTRCIPRQHRSADEPTDYFYSCRNCNHHWKRKG